MNAEPPVWRRVSCTEAGFPICTQDVHFHWICSDGRTARNQKITPPED